ncbi:MAG: 16S rRNA (guanine(527)-N(7))-methyltransferase RsmG [Flavobacteriales bacterium]
MKSHIIHTYFPKLSAQQSDRMEALYDVYVHWNAQINVISRKDIDLLYERHVLHSLAICKFCPFTPGSLILDIGTGGGFPGIPLAIMQPDVEFVLVDSIGKKIKVVNEVATALQLTNVKGLHQRGEDIKTKFDFVVSRAVAELQMLINWSDNKMKKDQINGLPNGLICLKGGDLKEELSVVKRHVDVFSLTDYFKEEFFETKKLIYVPLV